MTVPSVELRERVVEIKKRIAMACVRAHRSPEDIALVAASKTVSIDRIYAAIEADVRVFGENRVQEAATKIAALAKITTERQIEWHFIGHLQSNKVRHAVELFHTIQSVDSVKLATRLDGIAAELGRRVPILLEVNLGDESSKSGLQPNEVHSTIKQIREYANLELKGLMAVPPYIKFAEEMRPYFRRLRELRDETRHLAGDQFSELSMGMSHDFEVAIEEGATMVRIGTALFGPRQG